MVYIKTLETLMREKYNKKIDCVYNENGKIEKENFIIFDYNILIRRAILSIYLAFDATYNFTKVFNQILIVLDYITNKFYHLVFVFDV